MEPVTIAATDDGRPVDAARSVAEQGAASAAPSPLLLVYVVDGGTGNELVALKLEPSATLGDLRRKVATDHTKAGFTTKLQYAFDGTALDDESAMLCRCGVTHGARVTVTAPRPATAFRSLSAASFGGLGGMIGPDIGETHSKLGRTAEQGTPEYMLLRSGFAISVRSEGVASPTMIHLGLGTHNLLQVLCTLKCPVHGTPLDASDATSLIFYRCRYGIDGMQEPMTGAKKDARKLIKRDGTATGSKYLELDLTAKEQVKWLYCTITCSAA